ncbi:MAG: Transcription regulator AbrB/SpoV, predicted [archaeon GW2011_AR5]|nr:MAG: Transcription regulator AbrB/SpoV, predicted [archaeon GW2011_AR5]
MKAKIRQIGNSYGVILPKDFLDALGLKDGDEIDIDLKQKQIELVLKKA